MRGVVLGVTGLACYPPTTTITTTTVPPVSLASPHVLLPTHSTRVSLPQGFGYHVTHQAGSMLMAYYGANLGILVFKT